MKNLMLLFDDFIKTFTWKEIGLLKICVFGAAIPLGFAVAKSCRKVVGWLCFITFLATYIAVIWKFICFILERNEQ